MTIEELQKNSYYKQLAEGQQKYVTGLCEGKTKIEAAKGAWKASTDESAAAMAAKCEKNANVRWLIGTFFGRGAAHRVPTMEELAAWNWEMANKDIDPALKIKFAQNVAKIMGYESKPADNPNPPKPGDLTEGRDDGEDEVEI